MAVTVSDVWQAMSGVRGSKVSDKREILFRGRAEGLWIYGDLTWYAGDAQIWEQTDDGKWNSIVDQDTVCQYTGLDDRNGKKIFEGDIIVIGDEDDDGIFVVKWDTDTARFVMDADGWTVDFDSYNGYDCEVIGNIFDDPELLEGRG